MPDPREPSTWACERALAEATAKVVEAAGRARDADWSYRSVPEEVSALTVAVDELRALQETRA